VSSVRSKVGVAQGDHGHVSVVVLTIGRGHTDMTSAVPISFDVLRNS